MTLSHDHRDLFRIPTTIDKLNLLQSLLDAKDLTSDLALALINITRAELEQPQKQSAAAYRLYSEVTASLHKQMPQVYEPMAAVWQQRRQGAASADGPPRTLMQGSGKTVSPAGRQSEPGEKLEDTEEDIEEHVRVTGGTAQPESHAALEKEPGEDKEEHEESEEEKEDEEEEKNEKEEGEEKEEETEEQEGKEAEEKEDDEEEKEAGEEDEQNEEEEEVEENEEEQETEEPEQERETDAESEEVELEEVESEAGEKTEVESEEAAESEAEAEAGPEAEGDHMAVEAAEAQHIEAETETEPPEAEEEPPLEGME